MEKKITDLKFCIFVSYFVYVQYVLILLKLNESMYKVQEAGEVLPCLL